MPGEKVRARCERCGKRYRVADAGKTYRCKDCGGRVTALEEADAAPGTDARACPSCGAANPEAARFCERCGATLDGAGDRSRRRHGDAVERSMASRKLGAAFKWMEAVRAFYWACVVFIGLTLVFLVLGLLGAPEEDRPWIGVATAVTGADLALLVIGAIRIRRNPFLWTVVAASVNTPFFLIFLVLFLPALAQAPSLLSLFILIAYGLVSIGLWVAVPKTAQVRRLMREYPDLWVTSRRFRGERGPAPQGAAVTHARERAREARALAWKRVLLFGVLPVVILVAAIFLYRQATAPPAPAILEARLRETAERFASTWNGSRVDEIPAYFQESSREKMGRAIRRTVERRGWKDALPAVDLPRVDRLARGTARVEFPTTGSDFLSPLVTVWKYRVDRWELTTIRYPE